MTHICFSSLPLYMSRIPVSPCYLDTRSVRSKYKTNELSHMKEPTWETCINVQGNDTHCNSQWSWSVNWTGWWQNLVVWSNKATILRAIVNYPRGSWSANTSIFPLEHTQSIPLDFSVIDSLQFSIVHQYILARKEMGVTDHRSTVRSHFKSRSNQIESSRGPLSMRVMGKSHNEARPFLLKLTQGTYQNNA